MARAVAGVDAAPSSPVARAAFAARLLLATGRRGCCAHRDRLRRVVRHATANPAGRRHRAARAGARCCETGPRCTTRAVARADATRAAGDPLGVAAVRDAEARDATAAH